MTMQVKAWLPDGALSGGAVERACADAVAKWTDTWFARRLPAPPEPVAAAARAGDGLDCRTHEDGLCVSTSSAARYAMAGLMLDVVVDGAALNAADKAALEALAGGCIEDLCTELARAFGLGGSAWERGGVDLAGHEARCYAVGLGGGAPPIRIAVETSAAVGLIKAAAPAADKRPPLQPLRQGLSRQTVGLSARLGCCDLSVAELAALQPGDVLVLDRLLDDPLDLAVAGEPTRASCTVEQEGGSLHLKILKPLGG